MPTSEPWTLPFWSGGAIKGDTATEAQSMATPRQFAQNMGRLADKVQRNATRLQRTTAGAILQAVVLGTPVGNPTLWQSRAPAGYSGGRARANWQVGLGGAVGGVTDAKDAAGSATITAGGSRISGSTPGQDIHLTNNLPYIVPLNEGHSKQAPAGFIEQAVRQGEEHARSARILD